MNLKKIFNFRGTLLELKSHLKMIKNLVETHKNPLEKY